MWIDEIILSQFAQDVCLSVFVPDREVIVLGASNAAPKEVLITRSTAQGIPILQRAGGGGTVLLHPGCVVVSLGTWTRRPYESGKYFDLLNSAILTALQSLSPSIDGLMQQGISDLAVGNRKIAGSSLFRSRNYLMFQQSILVEARIARIEDVLSHPSLEPTYRAGRCHRDFLTDLQTLDPGLTPGNVCDHLRTHLLPAVKQTFGEELIPPCPAQFSALRSRLERLASEMTSRLVEQTPAALPPNT